MELVEELAAHGVYGHETVCVVVFRDNCCAVGCDLSDAEGEVDEEVLWVAVEVAEVGTGYVGGAFDEVASYQRAG